MRKMAAVFALLLVLAGCKGENVQMDRVLKLRSKMLNANGCSFDAVITADYGRQSYEFTLACIADNQGNIQFTVQAPDSISGITGRVSTEGGKLTFDDKALAFELLADGQLSPVSSPWVLVKTLRSGYITACGMDGDDLFASIDDSYADDALHMDIWFDAKDLPMRADILWSDRRYLSMEVKNFQFL